MSAVMCNFSLFRGHNLICAYTSKTKSGSEKLKMKDFLFFTLCMYFCPVLPKLATH